MTGYGGRGMGYGGRVSTKRLEQKQNSTTMDISKLHWRYAHEAYTINAFIKDQWLHLRVCAHGYDENGEIRHTLYCTADGRFFHRLEDGWREILPSHHSGRNKYKSAGGNYDCPFMRQCPHLYCHKLVCTAFHGLRPDGYECDHLNGNHYDWTADNLQWVTTEENRRRANYARRLRKIGIHPKWLTYYQLQSIYKLNAEEFDYFIEQFKHFAANDPSPLSKIAIVCDVFNALDSTYSRFTN